MRISIVTVVKNNARGLRLTGRSLAVQQDPPEYEWIVIDGASTDGTADVITEFAELNPIFISESDRSPYAAMNRGLEMAQGDYVWFLNGGDCLSDARVLREVTRHLTKGFAPDYLYGDSRVDGTIFKAKPLHHLTRGPVAFHQAALFRRVAIGTTRYDETYEIAADYAFTLEVAGRASRGYHMTRVICDVQGGGLSIMMAPQKRDEQFAIRKHVLQMPDWQNHAVKWFETAKARFMPK